MNHARRLLAALFLKFSPSHPFDIPARVRRLSLRRLAFQELFAGLHF